MEKTTLTPEQKAISDQIKFTFEMHMNLDKSGYRQEFAIYKDMRITKCINTPKRKGVWGNGVVRYFIDKEKKEYTGIELLEELVKRTLTVSQ